MKITTIERSEGDYESMSHLNTIHKLIQGEDSYGNEYLINPKKQSIHIKLKNSKVFKTIGSIVLKNNFICYVKYEDENQRFKKTDAWSINWHIAKNVDFIYFKTSKDIYKISNEKAQKFGEFFNFRSSKELKLYVPVKYWDLKSTIQSKNK